MNESGAAVVPLVRRSGLEDLTHLVIVHDELDLEPGRLQLKVGGGLAGHNGLRSVAGALGTKEFTRLRLGIGKPPSKDRGADWVLSRPGAAARAELDRVIATAVEALEQVVHEGIEVVATRLNGSPGG
jgi:PTH1 family peptidyl-tRNA hydrolase